MVFCDKICKAHTLLTRSKLYEAQNFLNKKFCFSLEKDFIFRFPIYIRKRIYIWTYIYIYVYIYIYYIYIILYIYIYIYTYRHRHIYLYILNIPVYTYIYLYIPVCISIKLSYKPINYQIWNYRLKVWQMPLNLLSFNEKTAICRTANRHSFRKSNLSEKTWINSTQIRSFLTTVMLLASWVGLRNWKTIIH